MKLNIPYTKVILIVWVVFSILYVGWNEWTRFKVFVMQNSYQQGMVDAVTKVIAESKDCKAVPMNVGDVKASVVNVDCLKQAPAEAGKVGNK